MIKYIPKFEFSLLLVKYLKIYSDINPSGKNYYIVDTERGDSEYLLMYNFDNSLTKNGVIQRDYYEGQFSLDPNNDLTRILEKIGFPQVVLNEKVSSIDFIQKIIINGEVFVLFDIEPGTTKIEFYDYSDVRLQSLDYSDDEFLSHRYCIISTTLANSYNITLAFHERSINPHRNLDRSVLSTYDYEQSFIESILDKTENVYLDKRSNTLLSSELNPFTPPTRDEVSIVNTSYYFEGKLLIDNNTRSL